ncbi:hypothetical protein D1J63_20200 [Streptomyces sp. KPB2]|uniref:hypothetical protein n=1 Tax=Streptomyces sp. KPB2 TaxID=2305221 RepID=UPI000F6E6579|nr:hypothetical protein [Streptomyces sp. KPB2]AZM77015.1 hypothetical protein D1J63_20200 [Streptomyces sp. KPB2]
MPDRLNQTPGHRTAGAAPARTRPQGRQQPPLASLQAAAGNRAVASAIRRGSGTAIQRATGTAQLPRDAVVARATAPAVDDDLRITPVTETGRPAGGTGRAADPATEQQAAVDEVAAQKAKVATASRARADAETDVWKASGEAAEARRKAAGARGRAEKLEGAAGAAELSRTSSLEAEERFTEAAGTAMEKQRTAEERAGGLQSTENGERAAAKAARAEERKYTEAAEEAEKKREAAEERAADFKRQADDARQKQAAAEAEVAKLKEQARKAEEQQKAAEAAARAKAEAEDEALRQAARAEAEAEAEDEIARRVKKWAEEAAEALKQAGEAEEEARRQAGESKDADDARKKAADEANACAEDRDTALEQAKAARDRAALREKNADGAARERGKAEREAERHKKAADQALRQADRAQADADRQAHLATERRQQAQAARAEERGHARDAAEAQDRAAAAGQRQLDQRAAQTTATTALSEAKQAREAEQEKAKKAAEEKAKKAAEQKKTKEAAKPDAPETAEQADGAEPAGTGKAGGSRGKGVRQALGAVNSKVKSWVDTVDLWALRASAPYSGTRRSDATQHGDTGTMHDTTVQQLTEGVPNAISDFTGTADNLKALRTSYKKRNESGPASHEHRKGLKSKLGGAMTSGLMLINDFVKGADNIGRVTENVAGAAELGATSGGLVIGFSALTVGRDIKVFKDTRAQREELKKLFGEQVAKRDENLQKVLNTLGEANTALAEKSIALANATTGADARKALDEVEGERARIEDLREHLMGHLASGRDYAVKKKGRKLRRRAINGSGNIARTAAGAVGIAAAAGAVSGGIGAAVVGGTTALALGEGAVEKGLRKANKRYDSVRDYKKHARTTLAQQGTPEPEPPKLDEDGRGRKSDALKEAVMVTHSIKQGKRQLNAQELYAQAAGPAVPVGENVPEDIRSQAREFLRKLKCSPVKHNQTEEQWLESLNDPDLQTEWEGAIAKALSSS